MRLYIPATLATVARLRATGAVPPGRAYAVTPVLRSRYPDADEEELEYLAFSHAAQAALGLLAADPVAPRRRVVISADAPATAVTTGPERSAGSAVGGEPAGVDPAATVLPTGPVPLAAVAAVHVDGAAAEPAVGAAVAALPAARGGGAGSDAAASTAVAEVAEHELEWYDVSELSELPA